MIRETIYNAFTKIGTVDRRRLITFLYRNTENTNVSEADVKRALEYAIKDLASFGGFVLTLEDNKELLGVAVINQTGMEGNSPKNVLVQIATSNTYKDGNLLKQLVDRVLHHTDGELGLQIMPDNPAIAHFENFGFRKEFVMMALRKPSQTAKIYRRYRAVSE